MLKIYKLNRDQLPPLLAEIPDPPQQLYVLGDAFKELVQQPCLAVVGSRKVSAYGTHVTKKLIEEVAGLGVTIISGLAIGLDGLAHQAALDGGGKTIAVLPCGLDRIYPGSNRNLALRILENGGAIVSEYPEQTEPQKYNFIARNRLISGLAQGLLIPEAAEKSGSLHTANFALEQGRTVMAVPGNITSPTSAGTNNLIKSGATPITSVKDILQTLGLESTELKTQEVLGQNAEEQLILDLLKDGVTEASELLARSQLDAALFNQNLTMLEISGKIRPLGAGNWIIK